MCDVLVYLVGKCTRSIDEETYMYSWWYTISNFIPISILSNLLPHALTPLRTRYSSSLMLLTFICNTPLAGACHQVPQLNIRNFQLSQISCDLLQGICSLHKTLILWKCWYMWYFLSICLWMPHSSQCWTLGHRLSHGTGLFPPNLKR